MLSPRSPLLDWPNKIPAAGPTNWAGLPAKRTAFDAHYQRAVALTDDNSRAAEAVSPLGWEKGMFFYTGLALDRRNHDEYRGGEALGDLLSASARPKS